jgi:quercetin dioxygenase-like cupin family protein
VELAASELKWVDAPGVPPNTVKLAVVQGDPATGPHHAFHKFPAGFTAPLHHHTSDHYGTVISGTMVITPEGGAPKKLPAGSYWEITGAKKHTTKCEPGSDCVIFIDCRGKWDVVMAEAGKKEPAKK